MKIDELFKKAYLKASNTPIELPPDVMLKLYALYKRATDGNTEKSGLKDTEKLVHAFKMNARMQIKHLSKNEAKEKYIKIVNTYIE